MLTVGLETWFTDRMTTDTTNDRAELVDFLNRSIEAAEEDEAANKSHLGYGNHAAFRYAQGRKHALRSVMDWLSNHVPTDPS